MKRRMWLLLVLPLLLLFVAFGVYWEFFANNLFWLLSSVLIAMVWLVFAGLLVNINSQVDDNPYYTQMVLRKRDEVRALQRAYAATHKIHQA